MPHHTAYIGQTQRTAAVHCQSIDRSIDRSINYTQLTSNAAAISACCLVHWLLDTRVKLFALQQQTIHHSSLTQRHTVRKQACLQPNVVRHVLSCQFTTQTISSSTGLNSVVVLLYLVYSYCVPSLWLWTTMSRKRSVKSLRPSLRV